ncbi:MAG: hypothetical protein V2B15_17355 [Bacteroidota bacterium]
MKQIFILVLLLFPAVRINAQLKTYVTLEAGPHWSMIRVDDPGNFFDPATVSSSIGGFTIEQEVMKNLSVCSGLYYLPYKTGINMADQRKQQSRNNAYNALMIPIRVAYRVQPTDYPVSFTPKLGYWYSINTGPETGFSNASILSAPDGTAFSYSQVQSGELPGGHLLEMGLGIGLRFSGLWTASLNLSYLSGALGHSASSFALDYSDQQGIAHTAYYNTRGNGFHTTLSFHVPVSNLWQNRDYRIRSRIENSLYIGKSVERKGQFYAGGELGVLWRLFHISNPAVGARPMEKRGLFRYSNLHTGVYAGYMLTQELGVDLGVNYQRSNTFYTLMYDHEVDFVEKAGAPMYLEVPLRFRYFYDLYEERMYAVVYGGASLLTHFSSRDYSTPGGDFTYTSPATQAPEGGTVSSTTTRLSHFRPLLRLGMGVEYKLPMKFPMFATVYLNYMQGFMATEDVSIITSVPESPVENSVSYNGSGWSLDVGVKIPFAFDDRENCVRLTKER